MNQPVCLNVLHIMPYEDKTTNDQRMKTRQPIINDIWLNDVANNGKKEEMKDTGMRASVRE